ncbi:MAG: TIGR00282 family metallophosphoesterase [Ruminococcaceae bacterium]|nr:TIGR00282 family metallophosphoesterase [Oscillospiraceae bacterium]
MSVFRVLALGDIVGKESTEKVCRALPAIKRDYRIDFTVANGENAAQGNGLDRRTAETLLGSGIDVLTSGNHIWQKRDIMEYIDEQPYVLRPANYPKGTPGKGAVLFQSGGRRILVMNVLGTVYLEPLSCPFAAVEEMLDAYRGGYDLSILDVHAEATSEKLALANYFDGKIDIIFGTHTHVQTADTRIFPKGTGYLTDLGMCGAVDSILGVSVDCIVTKFRTRMPVRFENPVGAVTELNGAVFQVDTQQKRVTAIELLRKTLG